MQRPPYLGGRCEVFKQYLIRNAEIPECLKEAGPQRHLCRCNRQFRWTSTVPRISRKRQRQRSFRL